MDEKSKDRSWKEKISNLIFEENARDENLQEDASSEDNDAPYSSPPIKPAETLVRKQEESSRPIPTAESDLQLNLKEIYHKAGIQESSFATPEQVLELQATFSDLPLDLQKQKVLKTLASFKVDINAVVDNTRAKATAIRNFLSGIQTGAQSTIETSNQTIGQLQAQMDACRQRITEAQALLDQTTNQCRREMSQLQGVLEFLGVSGSFDGSTKSRLK